MYKEDIIRNTYSDFGTLCKCLVFILSRQLVRNAVAKESVVSLSGN